MKKKTRYRPLVSFRVVESERPDDFSPLKLLGQIVIWLLIFVFVVIPCWAFYKATKGPN